MPTNNLIEVSMVITKASVQADGSMRWAAVTSDTSPDNTGESTSLSLFQDWVQRTESGETVDYLPPPRKPFLGVSHYSDLSGEGEAGITEEMGVDSNRFKAKGVFKTDSPLGLALANAVKSETDLVKRGGQPEKPIRISAAWWDIEHSHGTFIFTRKSLTDVCSVCEEGGGNKVYLKGQLDHFATTRVPINPRTSLALQEKSMAITRKDDAASIVGDELAEELEEKSKLVGKSEAALRQAQDAGLVVKAKPNPFKKKEEEEDKAEGASADEEEEDAKPGKKKGKGGSWMTENKAFTMADARALPVAKSASRLELMALVKRNISDLPTDEQLPALMALMDEVHDEVTQIKEAVEEVWFLQPLDTAESQLLDEDEELPPMEFLQTFTDQVEQTLSAEGQTKEEKAAVIQKALNDVTLALSRRAELVDQPPAADIVLAFKAAMSDGMAPLIDQIAQMNARLGAPQQPVVTFPVQKSVTSPALNTQQPQQTLPVSPITGQESSLTQMVRRSVGLY